MATCKINGAIKKTKKRHLNAAAVRKTIAELIPAGCGTIDIYERLDIINSGSYGEVHKALHKETGDIVAIKKEFAGLRPSMLREIRIFSSLHHPSVVGYKEVAVDDHGGVYVVMEFADHDLNGYIYDTEDDFTLAQVKGLIKDLLEGVEYLHEDCRVMHRDLKPSNLLIDARGKLKICDFGMSRKIPIVSVRLSTIHIPAFCYRAPELLLGQSVAEVYSAAVDMWSVGCIMAEILLREVLFRGWSATHQLRTITTILEQPREFRHKFEVATYLGGSPVLSDAGFDLLCQLLAFDPEKRITAREALKHHWFHE